MDTRGAAAMEFALAGMFILGMMFAVVEVGQVMTIKNALDRAVNVGARYASVNGSASSSPATLAQIKAKATAEFNTVAGPGLGTPTIVASFDTNNNPGSFVTLTATLAWAPIGNTALVPAMTLSSIASLPILN